MVPNRNCNGPKCLSGAAWGNTENDLRREKRKRIPHSNKYFRIKFWKKGKLDIRRIFEFSKFNKKYISFPSHKYISWKVTLFIYLLLR